jgi:ferritin-like metal-binding protein YciE
MTPTGLEHQLIKYLTDAHSIERQALAQLKMAPKIAGDPDIAEAFRAHLAETEDQERLVRERLEAHGASPAAIKDLAGALTGKGFVLFAQMQPDTPGKLVAHAFSYEHMEQAAYELLLQVAQRAGDGETAEVARRIGDQEPESLQEQLNKYLADAHAIEAQAIKLLEKAPRVGGTGELASAYEDHLHETEEHQRLIEVRLQARGASPSRIKDAALSLGALNWGAFFQAQPDTPAKLAGFAYAFEHLEIAGYELLLRVARRVADDETEAVAERILSQERAAAERIHSLLASVLDQSLQEQGVGAR